VSDGPNKTNNTICSIINMYWGHIFNHIMNRDRYIDAKGANALMLLVLMGGFLWFVIKVLYFCIILNDFIQPVM
jgi:hypothetical protein